MAPKGANYTANQKCVGYIRVSGPSFAVQNSIVVPFELIWDVPRVI